MWGPTALACRGEEGGEGRRVGPWGPGGAAARRPSHLQQLCARHPPRATNRKPPTANSQPPTTNRPSPDCRQELSEYQAQHVVRQLPGPLEFLSYSFSLANLLSGPHFEFVTWKEFIELKGVGAQLSPGTRSSPFLPLPVLPKHSITSIYT